MRCGTGPDGLDASSQDHEKQQVSLCSVLHIVLDSAMSGEALGTAMPPSWEWGAKTASFYRPEEYRPGEYRRDLLPSKPHLNWIFLRYSLFSSSRPP